MQPTTLVLPPTKGRQAGRPKTKRRRGADENGTYRCGSCGGYGHNVSGCDHEAVGCIRGGSRPLTRGGVGGRPRKRVNTQNVSAENETPIPFSHRLNNENPVRGRGLV